jgi:hypothetical protein
LRTETVEPFPVRVPASRGQAFDDPDHLVP